MLAFVSILSSGPRVLHCTKGPNEQPALTVNYRTISGASTNLSTLKDRVYSVVSGAVQASDYTLSIAGPPISGFFSSDNPSAVIDSHGSAPFTVPVEANLFCQTLYGTYVAYQVNWFTNTQTSFSNLTAFANTSLASNLQYSIQSAFTGKTTANWSYSPSIADLGTNKTIWTYPPYLSCVGVSSGGFQVTLVSPGAVLGNNHIIGNITPPAYATFTDTNGIKRIARITSNAQGPNDFAIGFLETNLTSAVVPASVLPVFVTNYITSWLGIQSAWAHNNTAHVDLGYVSQYPGAIFGNSAANGMWIANARTNVLGNEVGATPGDSSSPALVFLKGTPIILFSASQAGDVAGEPVFDSNYWSYFTNHVSGYSQIDLSGYPTY